MAKASAERITLEKSFKHTAGPGNLLTYRDPFGHVHIGSVSPLHRSSFRLGHAAQHATILAICVRANTIAAVKASCILPRQLAIRHGTCKLTVPAIFARQQDSCAHAGLGGSMVSAQHVTMEAYLVTCVQNSLALYLNDNAKFLCERLVATYPREVQTTHDLCMSPHVPSMVLKASCFLQQHKYLLATCYKQCNQAYRAYYLLQGEPQLGCLLTACKSLQQLLHA